MNQTQFDLICNVLEKLPNPWPSTYKPQDITLSLTADEAAELYLVVEAELEWNKVEDDEEGDDDIALVLDVPLQWQKSTDPETCSKTIPSRL